MKNTVVNKESNAQENDLILLEAIGKDSLDVCAIILKNDPSIDLTKLDKDGKTVLHHVNNNNYEMFKLLIDHGADSTIVDKNNQSALWSWSNAGFAQRIENILLPQIAKFEQDVDKSLGETSDEEYQFEQNARISEELHAAVAAGNIELVRTLVSQGHVVNSYDINKKTMLHLVPNDNTHLFEYLIDQGADITIRDEKHTSCLYSGTNAGFALRLENIIIPAIKRLERKLKLEKKSSQPHSTFTDLKLIDKDTQIKTLINELYSSLDSVDIYSPIDLIAKITEQNHTEYLAEIVGRLIHKAVYAGDKFAVLYFLKAGHKINDLINIKDEEGNTVLHIATKLNNVDVCKTLIQYGADIDAQNKNGETPLHVANDDKIIEILVASEADISIRNLSNKTCLYAFTNKNFAWRVENIVLSKFRNIKGKINKTIISEQVTKDNYFLNKDLVDAYHKKILATHATKSGKFFVLSEDLNLEKQGRFYYYLAYNSKSENETEEFAFRKNYLSKISKSCSFYKKARTDLCKVLLMRPIDLYDNVLDKLTDINEAVLNISDSDENDEGLKQLLLQNKISGCVTQDSLSTIDDSELAKLIWVNELNNIKPQSKHYADAQYKLHNHYYVKYIQQENKLDIYERIEALRKAFKHLSTAKLAGNVYAKLDLANGKFKHIDELRGIAHTQETASDAVLLPLLKKTVEKSAQYVESQRILFEIYYFSYRYYKTYSSYIERYKDIYEGFKHLVLACKSQPGSLTKVLENFNLVNAIKPNGEIDENLLKIAAFHELAVEQLGLDHYQPKDLIHASHAASTYLAEKKSYHLYKMNVLSRSKELLTKASSIYEHYHFKNSPFSSASVEVLSAALLKNIQSSIVITKSECQGDYHKINLTIKRMLSNKNKIFCFVDNNGLEVARAEMLADRIIVTGHGKNIHLAIDENLDTSLIAINNLNAHVKLSGSININHSLMISAKAKELILQDNIRSSANLNIAVEGKFQVNKDVVITANKNLIIQSDDAVIDGKLNSAEQCQINVKSALSLAVGGEIYSESALSIRANALPVVKGNIKSNGNLSLDIKDSIYVDSAATISAKKNLSLLTKKLMSTDKATIRSKESIKLDVKDNLVLEKNSVITSEKLLSLKTASLSNYSHIEAESLMIDSPLTVIHNTGKIKAKNLQFTGGSVWNGGSIEYKGCCTAKLNKLFVHGLSGTMSMPKNLEELKNTVCPALISGGNLNIIAGGYFNIAGLVNVKNFTLSALAAIDVGLTAHLLYQKSTLLSLDFGINLPNLPQILYAVKEKLNKLNSGSYQSLARDIFSWETVVNTSSFLRWILKKVIPILSIPADLVWGFMMFIVNTPNVFKVCSDLYYKKTAVELSDVIPLLQMFKGIFNEAMMAHTQIESMLHADFSSIQWHSFANAEAPALSLDLLTLLGPTTNTESLFSLSGSIAANTSMNDRSAFSYDVGGIKAGANISNTYITAHQGSNAYANNYSVEAVKLAQTGNVKANNFYANVEHYDQSGSVSAQQGSIHSKEWNQMGDTNVNHMNIQVGTHYVSKEAHLSLINSTESADNITIAGDAMISTSVMHVKEDLTITKGSDVTVSNSSVSAENFNNVGNFALSESLMQIEQHMAVAENAQLIVDKSKLTVKSAKINGKVEEKDSDLEVEGRTLVAESGELSLNNAALKTNELFNANKITATDSAIEVNGAIATKQGSATVINHSSLKAHAADIDGVVRVASEDPESASNVEIETTASFGKNSDVSISSSILKANSLEIHGNLSLEDALLETKSMVEDRDANISATRSAIKVDDVSQSGKISLVESVLEVSHAFSSSEDSTLSLAHSAFTAGQIYINGKGSLTESEIKAHDQLTLSKTAKLHTDNVNLISENKLDNAAQIQQTNTLYIESKRLNNTAASNIQGDGAVTMRAESGQVGNNINVNQLNVNISTATAQDLYNILNNTHENSLSFVTQNAINIDRVINTDREVAIKASSVNVGAAVHSHRSIIMEATQGNVETKANIVSDEKIALISDVAKVIDHGAKIVSKENTLSGKAGVDILSEVHAIKEQKHINIFGHQFTFNETHNVVQQAQVIATAGDNNILSEAGGVHVQGAVVAASQHNNLLAHGNVNIDSLQQPARHLPILAGAFIPHPGQQTIADSTIIGAETIIGSQAGDVNIKGAKIVDSNYTQIIAENGNVNIDANEKNVKGRFDTMKQWDPTIIVSGAGEGHDGNALVISAGNKVNFHASSAFSLGNNLIYGKYGVDITPAEHKYISKRTKKTDYLGYKESKTKIISTQVQTASLTSVQGRNLIASESGDVNLVALQMVSRGGNDIFAGGNINILDLVTKDEKHRVDSNMWGVNQHTRDEYHEKSVPTVIANFDKGVTRIHAGGNINSRGTEFYMPGKAEFSGKNITISASVLENEVKESSRSLSVSAFGQTLLGDGPSKRSFLNPDPTIEHAKKLGNSANGVELAINGASTAIDALNTVNTFTDAMQNGQMLDALANRAGLSNITDPKLTVTYSESKTVNRNQSLAAGGLITDDLMFNADEKVTLQGVPVRVSGDMTVNAKIFEQLAQSLKQSSSYSKTDVSVTPTEAGKVDIGVNRQTSHTNGVTNVNQQTDVGGKLTVNTDKWLIDGAKVEAKQLTGHVNDMIVTSRVDTLNGESKSVNINTNGSVAFQDSKTHKAVINDRSGLHVLDGINNQFTVKNVDISSADMTDADRLQGATVVHHELKTYDKTDTHGFLASYQDTKKLVDHYVDQAKPSEVNRLKEILDEKTVEDVQDKVNVARALTAAVYDDDLGKSQASQLGLNLQDTYVDPETGTAVAIYTDEDNKEVYIAFQGSQALNSITKDDYDIFVNGMPRSVQNEDMERFIADEKAKYEDQGYDLYLTGHSRGATQASIISSEFDIPAIVFDNPGVPSSYGLNLSEVISFQSTPNIVNCIPEINGIQRDYGNAINLPKTFQDELNTVAVDVLAKVVPISQIYTIPKMTLFSHSIDEMSKRIDAWEKNQQVNNGPNYNRF